MKTEIEKIRYIKFIFFIIHSKFFFLLIKNVVVPLKCRYTSNNCKIINSFLIKQNRKKKN